MQKLRYPLFRTYKYLLRPNIEQFEKLDFVLSQSRLVYNAALEQRMTIYQDTGKGSSYGAQCKHFRKLRRENPDTIGVLNASSLQQLLRRLDKSFSAFFRRLKAGEKPGFPRFKGRNRFKSIEFTYGDGCKLRQNEHGHRSFYVQNVGELRMCYHRVLPDQARIKRAVVKQVNHRWYVCLTLDVPKPMTKRTLTGGQVGVDIGLKRFAALSTGELIENPRWLRGNLAKLRGLSRHASRQVKGSSRQKKTYQQIGRLHERIANERSDYLHKTSQRLVAGNDLIAIENLSLGFMNRNRRLALSSHDASFGRFRQMLEYKAEEAGVQVIAVNPSKTTQVCSECGAIAPKRLSIRVHTCPDCGLVLDRDVNAARNILALALQIPLGRSGRSVTRAVAPYVG